jgi:hypothetical protein
MCVIAGRRKNDPAFAKELASLADIFVWMGWCIYRTCYNVGVADDFR